ncbi:MAG: hypothetical protein IPF67_11420 [Saprospiraceae bacterium]|nr:hypothetical protein [Candidatus Brachybacter algidus]
MKNILFKTVILASAFFAISNIEAQSALDVLRLSDQTLIGTGRAAGTNTNMSGIGADFTTLSSNPAGIAQYRKSEIMLSPTVTHSNIESTLLGGSVGAPVDESKTKFRLPNLGIVIAKEGRTILVMRLGSELMVTWEVIKISHSKGKVRVRSLKDLLHLLMDLSWMSWIILKQDWHMIQNYL